MQQSLIIPYAWEGMDYTTRSIDSDTGETIWGSRKYRIFIWGHDQYNDPVCWIVDDYLPYCYIRIDATIENEEKLAPQIMAALNDNILQFIKKKSENPKNSYLKSILRKSPIVGYRAERKRPMFYWNDKKDLVYKVFFCLEAAMFMTYEYLTKNKIILPNGYQIPASSFNNGKSDRIPTEEKLIVERKLERCSWIYADTRKIEHDGQTFLEKEYVVSYTSMNKVPIEYMDRLGFPKPSTISFDAETFSKIYSRFPKATRLTDCMYAMGYRHRVYSSLHDTNPTVHNYIFVIWDVEQFGELKDFSDIYGPMTYIYCLSEEDFYVKLFMLIIKLNPTWFISFNGLGFDWAYIEDRCSILGVKVPNLSRMRYNFRSQFNRKNWKKTHSIWPNYPGRMDVDMLYIIRIQFKYNSYKLKNVAKELLPSGHDKIELAYKEQFRIFDAKEKDGMNKIMDYLLTDILLPEELYDVLNISIYLHTNGSVMRVNPFKLYTEGQSIRCVCQLHYEADAEGMYIDSREITTTAKYIGGLVVEPKTGISRNVLIFDWNSLYPSEMKVDNICFTTLINEEWEKAKPLEDRIKDEDCHIVEGEVPVVDKKTKEVISMDFHRFRYKKKSPTTIGLLPKIVIRLNDYRSVCKKDMNDAYAKAKELKKELEALGPDADPQEVKRLKEEIRKWTTEGDIGNVKQCAAKVSANSIYGFMGMKTGKFSFIEGGMSTTIAGRQALEKTLSIATKTFGAEIIYGDTDSIMVQFPEGLVTPSTWKADGGKIALYMSEQFEDEMTIVIENFLLRFFAVSKKRYAGIKIHPIHPERFPTLEEIYQYKLLYIKGLITVRGNSCGIVYKNFNPFILNMLREVPIKELFDFLHDAVLKVMRREYDLGTYTFVQKLGANYKLASNEMAVFSDRLKQRGRAHGPGEELEYVYVKTYGKCLVGHMMQPPDLFVEDNNVLNTMYYTTNKLAKPLEQLLTSVYDDSILSAYEKKIIRPKKATKAQTVTPYWHLELYIRKYIATIHANWEMVMNEIKCIRELAEQNEYINYIIDETSVEFKMRAQYGIIWTPISNENKINEAQEKVPIHRHKVWMNLN
jgi:DNA polymerase elongation subunit (family B)